MFVAWCDVLDRFDTLAGSAMWLVTGGLPKAPAGRNHRKRYGTTALRMTSRAAKQVFVLPVSARSIRMPISLPATP